MIIPVYPGIQPLDVVGPHEVLRSTAGLAERGYDVTLVAREPGPVCAESGLQLVATAGLPESGPIGTLLVPGGHGTLAALDDDGVIRWLRGACARAERVASVCSGAFLLAAAGVLDGHPATTHWRWAAELTRHFPAVDVHPDAIWVRDGRLWTSAGVTAGIDLALALLEADHGVDAAQAVAREFVVFLRRPGGQSQFAAPVWTEPAARPSVRAAQDLIHSEPTADLRVPALAERCGMSERHFSREFTRLLGIPPGDYVEQVRVDTARRLLESEALLVTAAATRAGFGSAETMRRAFLRRLGVSPDHYRRHFATTP